MSDLFSFNLDTWLADKPEGFLGLEFFALLYGNVFVRGEKLKKYNVNSLVNLNLEKVKVSLQSG